MLSVQSLREQLDRYADGAISAESVEDWLAVESWDMHRSASTGLQRLVAAMQGEFIAYTDGAISAPDLHQRLIARREQLQRAQEVTAQAKADRVKAADLMLELKQAEEPSNAASEALLIEAGA